MNISEWIKHVAHTAPDKPAVICEQRQQSYAELAEGISRLAAVLQSDFKISVGDRVAYLGHSSPRLIEALFACAKIGAILVPLNWRLAVPELVHVLTDAEASLLIVGEGHAEAAAAATMQIDRCRPVYQHPTPDSGSWPVLDELMSRSDMISSDCADRSDLAVLILYTSGTTGKPKGAVLKQTALQCCALNGIDMHDLSADDHVLTVLPMFHAGGWCILTLPALCAGATITLQAVFEPAAVLASIDSSAPSLTALVPAQIKSLLSHPDWATTEMSHLRSVTTGSTYVPAGCIDPWSERGVAAIQVYGATETCAIAIHQTCADLTRTRGSVGHAAKHCEIRIVDVAADDLPAGQHGEIAVKGANLFDCYWRNSDATDEVLRDGWFYTGDIGYRRSDGAFVISDRKADLIISGGENIYPAELEAVLEQHPEISEVAVVGQPDDHWGEVPVAVIVATAGSRLDAESVKALFTGRLARFKHPQRIVFVEELRRNAMGKVEKFQLRQQIADTVRS